MGESATERRDRILRWLQVQVSQLLQIPLEEVDVERPFAEFGMDSMQSVVLSGDLERYLARTLPSTLVWDFPTIHALALHLAEKP